MKDITENNKGEKMKKFSLLAAVVLFITATMSCNNGLTGSSGYSEKKGRVDRSQRTVIDSQEYIDFTTAKYDARTWRREDILTALSGKTFKNGNSTIKINMFEGTIEMHTDKGFFNGEKSVQLYAKFGLDVLAANSDCLYIRKNPRMDGTLMVGMQSFKNDQIPDLTICLPLYGYSKNRIEISPVMNGYIGMPSGTYWNK